MFIGFVVLCALVLAISIYFESKEDYGPGRWFISLVVSCMALLGSVLITFITAADHARDIGTLRAYQHVITEHEARVAEMRAILQQRYKITEVQQAFNADAPVRAVVEAMVEATKDATKARATLAQAKVRIEQRKAGPMWFIVEMYGEQ